MIRFLPLLLTALFMVVSSCERPAISEAYATASEASHERMRLELTEVSRRVNSENPFLGNKKWLEAELAYAALPPRTNPVYRAKLLAELGWEKLIYGAENKAISDMEEARSMLKSLPPQYRDRFELSMIEERLALAYLRLAETENCCAKPNPESCIFPLQGKAIHDETLGAEKAAELLLELASNSVMGGEKRDQFLWLVNIAQMALGRSNDALPKEMRLPEESLEKKGLGFPAFKNIAAKAGVDTFGLSGGAVMDDFDGDGFFDLIVSQWDPGKSTDYFRNRGDGTFQKLSQEANLSGMRGGLNMKQADFDNDGDLDVYIMRGAWMRENGRHPNSLLRNDGVDRETGAVIFTDVTFAVGLGAGFFPNQVADWADFDLDGDLDLFVGNESKNENRFPCQLFRNDGLDDDGVFRFTDVAETAGVNVLTVVKGMSWGDFDGDRYPDLFISSIDKTNQLFRNLGDGTFLDVSSDKGIQEPARSFPAWFWDFNNDGHLDIFASSYMGIPLEVMGSLRGEVTPPESRARLYQNDGNGGFAEVSEQVGLTMPMLPMGSNFGDVMNDGFPDMYLGTGSPSYDSIVPNIFISNEQGQFVDRTLSTRLGHLQKGHAVSFADFDRDGDLDIFEQMGGAYRGDPFYDALYENPGETGNNWVSIRLKGVKSNSYGVGAKVRVVVPDENGRERSIYQWMNSGGSFGANPLELHFGLAEAEKIVQIEVFWPVTGKTQILTSPKINRRLVIEEQS